MAMTFKKPFKSKGNKTKKRMKGIGCSFLEQSLSI